MRTNNIHLFPIAVTCIEGFISQQQCTDIMSYINSIRHTSHQHTALTGNSISNHTMEIELDFLSKISENVDSCRDISKHLEQCITEYSEFSGYKYSTVTNSWFNIQGVGSTLRRHTHASASISGALYINVDSDSNNLCFDNPNYTLINLINKSKLTNSTFAHYYITPKKGDLVLFPGWLVHSSDETVNNTEDRTVISFNAK